MADDRWVSLETEKPPVSGKGEIKRQSSACLPPSVYADNPPASGSKPIIKGERVCVFSKF